MDSYDIEVDKCFAIDKAKYLLDPKNRVLIVDTETTSLDGVAIELCIIEAWTGKTVLDTLIHTELYIDERAQAIHGITKDMLAREPKPEDLKPLIKHLFRMNNFCAFNSKFDVGILENTFIDSNLFEYKEFIHCAMYEVAVPALGATNQYGTRSLASSIDELGLKFQGKAHRARADCLATLDMIRAIAEMKP